MSSLKHILTSTSAIIADSKGRVHTVLSDSPLFKKVKGLLQAKKVREALDLVDRPTHIKNASRGKFTVQDGVVVIDGVELPAALSNKLLALVDAGEDTTRLERFWDNLQFNPSQASVQSLYGFLEANNFPLTKDGCFLAYKKVRNDWKDIHSGTFENKPGTIVCIDRSKVDTNAEKTCSFGLHVAAYKYASEFSHSGRLLEVKVNPADVVAVPPDYSQQKMRVCRYVVMRETEQPEYTAETFDNDEGMPAIVEALAPATVHVDNEGRLRVPGRFLREVGLGVGFDIVVSQSPLGGLEIADQSDYDSEDGLAFYTVQHDNSVRISATVLADAGLGKRSKFTVEVSNGVVWIH